MKTRKFVFFFIIFCCSLISYHAHAQGIKGKITDEHGDELPFTNVYIKGTTIGTSSNEEGLYSLSLQPGLYTIVYQNLGYEKKEIDVQIENSVIKKNTTLKAIVLNIEAVTITNAENPAHPIMRKVIAMRVKHRNEIEKYECETYIKGINRLLKSPKKFMGQSIALDGVDSTGKGILYFSECISKLYFENPNNYNEEVIASKVSGSDNGISINRASFFDFNMYNEQLELAEGMAQRALITPTNDNAFMYYDFTLIKTYVEGNRLIDVIKFTPKRKHDNAFQGLLYIIDGDWHIINTDMLIIKNEHINLVDSVSIKQQYVLADEKYWVLLSQQLYFKAAFLVFNFNGNYEAYYKNYKINSGLSTKNKATNELMKAGKDASAKDSSYWEYERPVALTLEEMKDYKTKDSTKIAHEKPAYIDSMRRKSNIFEPNNLLFGYSYNFKKKWSINTNGLLNMITFNTVQGVVLTNQITIRKKINSKNNVAFLVENQYGFSDKINYTTASIQLKDNRKYSVTLEGGTTTQSWGNAIAISSLSNSITTLFYGQNYLKLFSKKYVSMTTRVRVAVGWRVYFENEYALRNSEENTSMTALHKNFISNLTPNKLLTGPHEVCANTVQISYTPSTKYVTMPDEVFEVGSDFPTFSVLYKNIFYPTTSQLFHHAVVKMNYTLQTKTLGSVDLKIKYGRFFGTNLESLSNADFYIPIGNRNFFVMSDNTFLNIAYNNGTFGTFGEGHLEWNAANIFGNKIPYIRKLKVNNTFGVNAFYTNPNYWIVEPFVSFRYSFYPITLLLGYSIESTKRGTFSVVLRLPIENNRRLATPIQ